MTRFSLYLNYAVRSFVRGGTRSMFAVLCVAVGVTAIVALQSVGGDFRASISGDAQNYNHGDVSVTAAPPGLSAAQYADFARLQRQGRITDYTPVIEWGAIVRRVGGAPNDVQMADVNGVQPAKYPFYGSITADNPAGTPLSRALPGRQDAAVSASLADSLGLTTGERIYVGYGPRAGLQHRIYTVTAILPDSALRDQNAAAGGFLMVSYDALLPITRRAGDTADVVYVKTATPTQAVAAKATLQRDLGPATTVQTATDVQNQEKKAVNEVNQFLTIMGLVAVVIGGVGIINTMLVATRRRRKEIAVVKSFGMRGRQVVLAFTLEALILGLLGGLLGIAGGIGASALVIRLTTGSFFVAIPWHIQVGPLVTGVVVALVFTTLFAFLPVQRGSEVRPIAALRDEDLALRLGLAQRGLRALSNLAMVVGLAVVMGIAGAFLIGFGGVLRDVIIGVGMGLGALLVLGLLTQLFTWVVWLVSTLPGMHSLTLRLAFRSMGRQRRRLASTVLALCVGILAVGTIAIIAANLKTQLARTAVSENKFNTVVFTSAGSGAVAQLRSNVAQLPGIKTVEYDGVSAAATLTTVDGKPAQVLLARAARQTKGRDTSSATGLTRGLAGRDLTVSGTLPAVVDHGRELGPQDAGTNHVVVQSDLASPLGIHVGSHLAYAVGGRMIRLTVVGIQAAQCLCFNTAAVVADNGFLQRAGAFGPGSQASRAAYLDIADGSLSADVGHLRRTLPAAEVIDLTAFLNTFNKVIDQFALFPELIGALCLFAGAVIIANTVALAMLERRREIGVMKAVGAKQRFVLQQLLTENAIVGLVGAGAGTLIGMLATWFLDSKVIGIGTSFNPLVIGGLVALGVGLAMGAAALTAWPASRLKPLTVLRYE